MSKRIVKRGKKLLEKVKPGNFLKIRIPAGKASAAPPLGPQLEFNTRTKDIKDGIAVCSSIKINPDRTHNLIIHPPTTTYFLFAASGIVRGAMKPGLEVSGLLSLKHIYEIAKIKIKDPNLEGISMRHMCYLLMSTATSLGIKVVRQLDVEKLRAFREERDAIVESQLREIQEKKQAKLLRTIT